MVLDEMKRKCRILSKVILKGEMRWRGGIIRRSSGDMA